MTGIKEAQKKWEKAFDKKMKVDEVTMFSWGFTYGVNAVVDTVVKMKNGRKNVSKT